MKKISLLFFALLLFSCSSSQFVTYRPKDSNNNWKIDVLHNSVTKNFKVVINDSTVIDKNANFFTGNAEAKGTYENKEVKMIVTFTPGFLGIGQGFEVMVFIENELAGKFKF